MQALWYTHQSASTGRHKNCGRCHQEARRSARIGTQSAYSSSSARAPSACTKPRRQPMIESTRFCGAIDRCEICEEHGPGVASDLLRGGLGGPGLGLDVLDDCAPSAALLLLVGHDFLDSDAPCDSRSPPAGGRNIICGQVESGGAGSLDRVGVRAGLANTWAKRPSRVDLEGARSLKPPPLVCIRAPYSRISAFRCFSS